jgi:FtsZ-binding cell division protein ZapB
MISDFNQLSEKISRLAEMTRALRRENAELRLNATNLEAENAGLLQRIEEAHQRVTALLDRIPVPEAEDDEEVA